MDLQKDLFWDETFITLKSHPRSSVRCFLLPGDCCVSLSEGLLTARALETLIFVRLHSSRPHSLIASLSGTKCV